MYEQDEIILIPFPNSDLTGAKQRPALIISNERINRTQDRICCLITSNKPVDGIEITNNCFERGRLPFKSWVKPHRIFTIDERIIKRRICKLNKRFHNLVLDFVNNCIN